MIEYFKKAKKSVFRFEQFQTYSVEEDDDQEALSEWLNFVKSRVSDGIIWQRVRMISRPLNDYTKKELDFFKNRTVKVGASVYVIDSEKKETLSINEKDFWLIDDQLVLEMGYNSQGKFLGFNVINEVESFLNCKEILLKNSYDINELNL